MRLHHGKEPMITITIGGEAKDLSDASESWINQQIQRLRHAGHNPCVQVVVNTPGVNVALVTPGCAGGGGGGRAPNENERRILDLWHKLHLDETSFSGGNVVAFLKQLKSWVA